MAGKVVGIEPAGRVRDQHTEGMFSDQLMQAGNILIGEMRGNVHGMIVRWVE
jgi:hypothetical protein